ncbi:hypothetical protein P12x_000081 [Tundrisphaera lichenicola]|uniref:hypothetical protein n=1 Tax=Tundrisphaera lichenicola TaxID=2029860 RepID=UPI003EB8DA35
MTQHIFARVSGFGWTLVPDVPFRFERVADRARAIRAIRSTPEGDRAALVDFTADAPEIRLDAGTGDLAEVFELLPGPGFDHWRIETSLYSARWPDGFALTSSPDPLPVFDLHGPDGSLLYIQGPTPRRRILPITSLAQPGQVIRGRGAFSGLGDLFRRLSGPPGWSKADLDYEFEGVPWRQAYRVVPYDQVHALLVTSQAPEMWAELASRATDELASSLTPTPQDDPSWPSTPP